MALFRKTSNKLARLVQKKVNLEKDIQTITEQNLETVFGLQLVTTEFQLNSLRIDTLAFDDETKSFVIIEYKKIRSFSVVDQGFAYLSLMLNNKADFILEYNERLNKSMRKDDVDWSQTRVIFVAPSFTTHQQNAINFKDLPIELWEIQEYENDLLLYNQLVASDDSESIDTIANDKQVKQIAKEIKKYTIEDLFKPEWETSKELFFQLRERIMEIDSELLERPQKQYIAYKKYKNNRYLNILEVIGLASGLKIYIDIHQKDLKDPNNIANDCSNIGHWATGQTWFKVENETDLDYAIFLIKQSYEHNNND